MQPQGEEKRDAVPIPLARPETRYVPPTVTVVPVGEMRLITCDE